MQTTLVDKYYFLHMKKNYKYDETILLTFYNVNVSKSYISITNITSWLVPGNDKCVVKVVFFFF